MSSRRTFIRKSVIGAGAILLAPSFKSFGEGNPEIKISLAEWSFHRALQAGKMDHLEFPAVAKKYGISAVEYVNGFFGGKKMDFKVAAKDKTYLGELLKRSKDAGVFNHLLMCDDEGPLSTVKESERLEAVENHKKWIEAAAFLGCLTVRVNLHGDGEPEERKKASIDSLSRLGTYAKPMNINVVVENHGSVTSNAEWLTDVMQKVNMKNVGTLPDFGNFCISHPWGTIQEGCKEMYDPYKGVELMLKYAKGVSAKTYDFDSKGEQPLLDYKRLIGIVKASGFKGYMGVEFEGNNQPEDEGVKKTQALIARYL
ncbi:MAG TPA: sugar phosphate isomerase/epimerase family protein [Bacteroidales bacterium]|nr:sugar phosphate isomerase/epimerase family protein [Bacteroidales bacterium]